MSDQPKHPDCVIAHQLLAAAKIVVEQLTALGYDDAHAASQYEYLKGMGFDDQAAIRMIAEAVRTYDAAPRRKGRARHAKAR